MTSFLLIATLVPASTQDLKAQAEAEYRAGLEVRDDSVKARRHFARSADLLEQLWENGDRTPEQARNMAQARFLSGDHGRSIRDYRRGLQLSPYDDDLRLGLESVRAQVGGSQPTAYGQAPTSPIARLNIPMPRLVLVAIGLSAIGWFLLARAWLTARGPLAILGGVLVLVAIGFGALLYWEDRRVRAEWAEPTAVLTRPTELFMGNSDEYPRRIDGKIPAGVEMRILGHRGGWHHVELPDGAVGWVQSSLVVTTD
jgi:hypothetical protein